MNEWRTWVAYFLASAALGAVGYAGFVYLPVGVWVTCSAGLFVVLSVLAAAVLVRLARPSPFSNPDVFTEANVEKYFDALIEVGKRLAVIFFADVSAILLLVYVNARFGTGGRGIPFEANVASCALAVISTFLLMRIVSVVAGDIGFIRLQRSVVIENRKAKAIAAAATVASKPTSWRSAGNYG